MAAFRLESYNSSIRLSGLTLNQSNVSCREIFMSDRRQESYAVRLEAAELARSRQHPEHKANGDEQRYAGAQYFMSFTKGLPHNEDTGLIQEPQDFVEFRRAIDDGFIEPFTDRVRHGAKFKVVNGKVAHVPACDVPDDFRQWEAPTAGVAFELEGPDAQAGTMPPAPPLMLDAHTVNPELAFEMAEVYELAILRDKPFNSFESDGNDTHVQNSIDRLNRLDYIQKYQDVCCDQPGRPRKLAEKIVEGSESAQPIKQLDLQTVFRGSSPGVEVGPYLSQFLLIGNTDINQDANGKGGGSVADGQIVYGVLQIDQRVPVATPKQDYMTDLHKYVEVQRGLRPDRETYVADKAENCGNCPRAARRFISTPRDLATYVHYDALYEAYLNACIILLGMGTPFDPGFDQLSGGNTFLAGMTTRRNAGGFALYGGPHILNLVTEVATRALKAVRFQKFNNHIRLRPEALAARIELVRKGITDNVPPALIHDIDLLQKALEANGPAPNNKDGSTLDVILKGQGDDTYFLPMAFPEGSPMHPAYGAGHATVAGACVTILKAFFDTSTVLTKSEKDGIAFRRFRDKDTDKAVLFRAPKLPNPTPEKSEKEKSEKEKYVPEDTCLQECHSDKFLTLEGELNKLAANISIGRNMAGVHYFTDYYDSLRMGEEIAIGILEEQALTYSTDPFVLSVPTFDGDIVRIGNR